MRVETRDVTGVVIRRVLFALLIHFRVYRVYVQPGRAKASDENVLLAAATRAKETLRPADHPALDVVLGWLGGRYEGDLQEQLLRAILARFEQLSAPLAAKAVEDTAFYRYGRFLALNEVGGTPARFFLTPQAFHERMRVRAQTVPQSLSPLATHDHKRGADTRARLAVLSERPEILATLIRDVVLRLEDLTQDDMVRITPVDLLMMLQTVLGAWPMTLDVDDQEGLNRYCERLYGWLQKAVREAKLMSNWLLPNEEYEAAVKNVLEDLFSDDRLRRPIYDAVQQIAAPGAVNSLAQVLMQCTAPGIPDLYQGTEMWDFSLVDPDNRRAVDFASHEQGFDATQPGDALLVHWRDGRIKQWLVARLFAWRRAHAELGAKGDYEPLMAAAEGDAPLLAYRRQIDGEAMIAIMPRRAAATVDPATLLPDAEAFSDFSLTLPFPPSGSVWVEVLTGSRFNAGEPIAVGAFFSRLPVALLEPAKD
jgi:(1->4)-alpha-D-glucan 1-alpha-D-glucosylmutase